MENDIPKPARRPARAHVNAYIDAEKSAQLEQIKQVNAEWVIERIRRAIEAEIESMWRIFQSMGNR